METFKTFEPYVANRGRKPSPPAARLKGGMIRFNTLGSKLMREVMRDSTVQISVGNQGTVQFTPSTDNKGRKLTDQRNGVVSLSVRGLESMVPAGTYAVAQRPGLVGVFMDTRRSDTYAESVVVGEE